MNLETAQIIKTLQDIACECERKIGAGKKTGKDKDTCRTLGTKKHDCCDDKIKKRKKDEEPKLGPEQGYDENGNPYNDSRKMKPGEAFPAYFQRIRGKRFPDAASLDSQGRPTQFFDFKFRCPKDVPINRKKNSPLSKGTSIPGFTPGRTTKKGRKIKGQKEKYWELGRKLKPKIRKQPRVISNVDC